MAEDGKLPTGRIVRLARLAAAGARSGGGMLLSRDGAARAASEAADMLGHMRGLAAKAGQMASYVDGMVPEEFRPAFEKGMAKLRAAAPSSSPEQIRAVVEEELEAPIDRLFEEWEEEPFASASIGQVHRAVLPDGREVAVKVQHPGIQKAVNDDLANASTVESLVRHFGAGKLGSKDALSVIRERFLEELDYEREAESQRWFARFHEGDDHIRVPAVVSERSSRRVLTSEMAHGLPMEEAIEADGSARRAWCRTLWRFVFRGNLVGGRFNADPHPGNYLFHPDGGVTFVDFGCVQHIPDQHRGPAVAMHRAAVAGDDEAFRRGAREMLETRGGRWEEFALDYTRRCFAPLFESPYRIEHPYVADLVLSIKDVKRELIFGRDTGFVPLPREMIFMNRLQFGFYSVLARFDAEVDYAEVERAFL